MKNISRQLFSILCVFTICFCCQAVAAAETPDPLDWPSWRGPQQNGVSLETGLITKWNPNGGPGSNVLWKNEQLATRSTPIVMRGKLYTLTRAEEGTPREGERVVCADAATGKILWENRFNVYLSDVPDTRVGWSCVTGDPATGKVYALGVCGLFLCIDGETGKTIWSRSLHEQYGLLSTYGGRTNTPVIFEDLVLISAVVIGWDKMAKPAHRFMAFDKATGEMVWFNGTRLIPYDTTYSVPTVTTLAGQAALVFGSGDGQLWALQPRTGSHLWNYPFSRRGLNVSPLVVGDTVFSGHSEENLGSTQMGALVAIDGTLQGDLEGKELWKSTGVMAGKSSPLYIDGRLYVIDDRAKLTVHDTKTGKIIARQALGTVQRSSPLYADGKIYTCTNNGRWYTLEPTEQGVKVLHKMRLRSEASDGSPICSHGRIYVPTSKAIYCLGNKETKAAAAEPPKQPQEDPLNKDSQVALVQVVPCEVLLRPGEKQSFKTRLFNKRGQFLREAEGKFSLKGPGELSPEGVYMADSRPQHTGSFVQCEVDGIVGEARVRVVPPLPWKFDFEDGNIPITWVGGRVRHVPREVDGEKIMVKIDQIPTRPGQFTKLGTRSRCWFGQDDLSNYTMQADVQGTIKDNKMPDWGLINQRYTMELQGASQALQIRSWATQLRMATTIPFTWKPGVWYRMKMTTELKDDKCYVRGKVWLRDEKEPEGWTVEAVDPSPNLQGAPGIFGNSKDAEIYIDNIHVTRNE